MLRRIARALLLRVYYSMTAVVCFNGEGKLLSVQLFDTRFPSLDGLIPCGTQSISLIISHQDGSSGITEEEIANCRNLAAQAGDVKMSIYVFGEDIGLLRVDRRAVFRYTDENAV